MTRRPARGYSPRMAVLIRLLFFLGLAGVLLWAAWTGSGSRRAQKAQEINAERRLLQTDAATQAYLRESPTPYPGAPVSQPATDASASPTTQAK